MTTIEHVKGHIDILKYVGAWLGRTCCSRSQRTRSLSIDHPPNPQPRDALDGLAGDLGGLRDLALGYVEDAVEVDGQVDNADMKAEQ